MNVTKFAQSTIRVANTTGKTLLLDPGCHNVERGFLNDTDNLCCDILVITHKHADHFDPKVLAKVTSKQGRPFVMCGADLKQQITELGFPVRVVERGNIINQFSYRILVTRAEHPVGGEDVPVFGVVIEADGKSIYHSSDTRYRSPHVLGVRGQIDCAFLPIAGRGVMMTEDEALVFARELHPGLVIPVHYDGPKDAHLQPYAFAERVEREAGLPARVLDYGETLAL